MISAGMLFGGAGQSAFDDLTKQAEAALDKDPEKAAELYQRALELRPDWAEGWFYLGASEYERKRFKESREGFLRATAFAPNNGPAWAFLGLTEFELGDYEGALQHLERGEALGAEGNQQFSSTVHTRSALLLIRAKRFGRAMAELQTVTRNGDDSTLVITALGLGALGMARLPGEIPTNKQQLVDLAGRATYAMYRDRSEEALTLFEHLAATYPNEPGVHYAYAIFLLSRDPELARGELRKEVKINPSHFFAELELAAQELKADNPQAAIGPAKRAVQMDPSNSLSHAALGRTYLKLAQLSAATSELEKAVQLAPGNPQMHFYLEQAYHRAGREPEAQKEKAEFARLKSTQQQANSQLLYTDPQQ